MEFVYLFLFFYICVELCLESLIVGHLCIQEILKKAEEDNEIGEKLERFVIVFCG